MGEPGAIWAERIALLSPYTVTQKVMDLTGNPHTKFLHCLPAFHNRDTTTGEKVFQTYDLARGELRFRERTVNPAAIRRTHLMTVEGERDDICSIGQTVAAHDLCTGIRPYMKTHHVQTGVGHYGVFSGRKWNHQIYPRVREMIHAASG